MNSYTSKLLQGTIAISAFFLSVCVLILTLFPVVSAEETVEVSETEFDSLTTTPSLTTDYSDETAAEYGLKVNSADFEDFADFGLELYRQPQSKPAVEWFYTHITGNREVTLAILDNADKNDIPLSLAFSLAYVESRYNPSAVNNNGNSTTDRGLFQLNSSSFPSLTESEFFDPSVSAKYGMSHLRWCIDLAGNDVAALAMYNAGTNRVRNNNTPQHTLNYVSKISNYRAKLEGLFYTEVASFYDEANRTKAVAVAQKASYTPKN